MNIRNDVEIQTATGALARHIAQTRFQDLSPQVVWEAKRRIADVIGAGLSGSTTPVGLVAEAQFVYVPNFCVSRCSPVTRSTV